MMLESIGQKPDINIVLLSLFSKFVKQGIDKTSKAVIKTTGLQLINCVNKICDIHRDHCLEFVSFSLNQFKTNFKSGQVVGQSIFRCSPLKCAQCTSTLGRSLLLLLYQVTQKVRTMIKVKLLSFVKNFLCQFTFNHSTSPSTWNFETQEIIECRCFFNLMSLRQTSNFFFSYFNCIYSYVGAVISPREGN